MAGLVKVRGRVTVLRVVAATDLPAAEAHAEVHPPASDLQALLAARHRLRQLGEADLVEVNARRIHDPERLSREGEAVAGSTAREKNVP